MSEIKDEINKAFEDISIPEILERATSDEGIGRLADLNNSLTPELRKQAENMAKGDIGKKIMTGMRKKGVSATKMRKEIKEKKKKAKALASLNTNEEEIITYDVVLVHNRKMYRKNIPTEHNNIAALITKNTNTEISSMLCYECMVGPLEDSDIFVYFNGKDSSVDRLSSLLAGRAVGDKAVFVSRNANLKISDLQSVVEILKNHKKQNKLNEHLDKLNKEVNKFSDHVIASTGLGEVLKEVDNLTTDISQYDNQQLSELTDEIDTCLAKVEQLDECLQNVVRISN
jgi:hypothetical protein